MTGTFGASLTILGRRFFLFLVDGSRKRRLVPLSLLRLGQLLRTLVGQGFKHKDVFLDPLENLMNFLVRM
jgi:hypothetical protein